MNMHDLRRRGPTDGPRTVRLGCYANIRYGYLHLMDGGGEAQFRHPCVRHLEHDVAAACVSRPKSPHGRNMLHGQIVYCGGRASTVEHASQAPGVGMYHTAVPPTSIVIAPDPWLWPDRKEQCFRLATVVAKIHSQRHATVIAAPFPGMVGVDVHTIYRHGNNPHPGTRPPADDCGWLCLYMKPTDQHGTAWWLPQGPSCSDRFEFDKREAFTDGELWLAYLDEQLNRMPLFGPGLTRAIRKHYGMPESSDNDQPDWRPLETLPEDYYAL